MNQAVSFWSFVPHHPIFPGFGVWPPAPRLRHCMCGVKMVPTQIIRFAKNCLLKSGQTRHDIFANPAKITNEHESQADTDPPV